MAGDLGAWRERVHDQAREVLDFWFGLTKEEQFAKEDALDSEIAERFGGWVEDVGATDATHCWDDPDTLLAAIIGVDQFTRNIHRGSWRAFQYDDVAQWLSLYAIGKGWDAPLPPERRMFLYMPLMHAEDRGLQLLSLGLFERLGEGENIRFAHAHLDAITRFTRFPGRNAALRRPSTSDEEQWLKDNNGGW